MKTYITAGGYERELPDPIGNPLSDDLDISIHSGEPPMSEDKLLPCPFCGGEADPHGWLGHNNKGVVTRGPECDGCGATTESVEAWNRREFMKDKTALPTHEVKRLVTLLRSIAHPHKSPHADYLESVLHPTSSGDKP